MLAAETSLLSRYTAGAERVLTLVLRGMTPADTPWRGVRLIIVWLLTRLAVMFLLAMTRVAVNDVNYYATVTTGNAPPDFPGTLREYPVPAVWWLTLPALLGGGDITAYGWWFVFLMLAIDGLFLLVIQRLGSPRAVTAWLAAAPLLGPMLLLRFDLLTGAAVATALLVVVARPRIAALLMVGAAAVKLWPAALVGIVAAASPRRRTFVVVTVVASVVLVAVVLAAYGGERFLSPLRYQSQRGIQVESLFAVPFMVLWALHVNGFDVTYGTSLAWEIGGPGTGVALVLSTLATLAAGGWTLWMTASLWRRPRRPDLLTAVAWATLSAACLLILSNKVFSPQYLAWLLPVVVVVVAVTDERLARTCAYLTLTAALAAQVLYPWTYDWIIIPGHWAANLTAVALAGARLALVGAVAWIATARAFELLVADAASTIEQPA
jgi:hypothetical protein